MVSSNTAAKSLKRVVPIKSVWALLAAPPVLFLLAIIAASIVFAMPLGNSPQAIADGVVASMSYVLAATLVAMFALLLLILRRLRISIGDLPWLTPAGTPARDAALGVAVGVALGLLYVFVLAPLHAKLQMTYGDYIPPQQLLASLGTHAPAFFVANILLAPFVEECVYRGFALSQLSRRFSQPLSLAITCIFFGLLHWAGGAWYILMTGVIAGGAFGGLFLWRKNLLAPFAAHLALNLVEFLYTALAQ